MRKIIAKVCLAQGQVGFFDPLTNIHLTMTKPTAEIYQGMNTSRIKASIASKRLKLISGSLNPQEDIENKNDMAVSETPTEVKIETVVEPEVKAEQVAESVEAPAEEVKAEPKKSSKKKVKKEDKVEE